MSRLIDLGCWIFIFYKSSLFAGRTLAVNLIFAGQNEAAERFKAASVEIWNPSNFLASQLIGIVLSGNDERMALVSGSTPEACVFQKGFCVDWAAALPGTSDLVQIASFLLPFSSWKLPVVALLQSISLVFYCFIFINTFELVLPWLIQKLITAHLLRVASLLYATSRLIGILTSPYIAVPLYISAFAAYPTVQGCLLLHICDSPGVVILIFPAILIAMSNPSGLRFRILRSQLRENELTRIHAQVIKLWAEQPETLHRLSLPGFLAVAASLKKSGQLPCAVVARALAERLQLRGLLNLSQSHFSEFSESAKSLLCLILRFPINRDISCL